jgi:hypothetical protein
MAAESPGLRPRVAGLARAALARAGMLPIQRVLRELERHGMGVGSLRALEVFGRTGERMTRWDADSVGSLDVWELNPRLELGPSDPP